MRFAKACVKDVNGLILLPDNWSSSYFALNSPDSEEANFSSNTITDSQWDLLGTAWCRLPSRCWISEYDYG
jgi:hypothetical protein